MPRPRSIFVTGGTGYIGTRLIPLLAGRGDTVRALTRKGSEGRLPALVYAVEHPADGILIVEVPEIRKSLYLQPDSQV